ncbi:MAG TPA: hypothetical protein VLM85_15235, partial [Polyangiaceae bacterium]|nr:hypothetical protein [Polyangiaceae bacterium]
MRISPSLERGAHFFAGHSPNLSGLDVKSEALACDPATEDPGAAAPVGDTSGVEVPPASAAAGSLGQ